MTHYPDLPDWPVLPSGTYRHYKGADYQVLGVARHSESGEWQVVYRPLYGAGQLWVRPLAMFCESVEIDGRCLPRFSPLQVPHEHDDAADDEQF